MRKVKLLDSMALFYEAYDDIELEHIVDELNERYEYYQKMMLGEVENRGDVQRRVRIIEGEIRDITEARHQIVVYRDIMDNTKRDEGVYIDKRKNREFDEVLVRRLVKKVEAINKEKCDVVLNSGQTINVSMEMNT